jgi:hypothetical protein
MQTEPHVREVQAYACEHESRGVRQPQSAREHRDQCGYEQQEAKLSEIRLHLECCRHAARRSTLWEAAGFDRHMIKPAHADGLRSVERQLICASFPIEPRGGLGVSARYTRAAYRTV